MKNIKGESVLSAGVVILLLVFTYSLFDTPEFDSPEGIYKSVVLPNQIAGTTGNGFLGASSNQSAFGGGPQGEVVGGYVSPDIKLAEGHWQGLEVIPLSSEVKKKLNIPQNAKGLLVGEVTFFAAKSGIIGGDILVAVNGDEVNTLEKIVEVSRGVKNRRKVVVSVVRNNRVLDIPFKAEKELGIVQVETAPMILAGAIAPHPYRGSCIDCHPIGNNGHAPDLGMITLAPPAIRVGMVATHQDRGQCHICHLIVQ